MASPEPTPLARPGMAQLREGGLLRLHTSGSTAATTLRVPTQVLVDAPQSPGCVERTIAAQVSAGTGSEGPTARRRARRPMTTKVPSLESVPFPRANRVVVGMGRHVAR